MLRWMSRWIKARTSVPAEPEVTWPPETLCGRCGKPLGKRLLPIEDWRCRECQQEINALLFPLTSDPGYNPEEHKHLLSAWLKQQELRQRRS